MVADSLEPIDMVNFSSPLAENRVVQDFGLPIRLVGDLLGEPEHEQLANSQCGGPPVVFKECREPVFGRGHAVDRLSKAGIDNGFHV